MTAVNSGFVDAMQALLCPAQLLTPILVSQISLICRHYRRHEHHQALLQLALNKPPSSLCLCSRCLSDITPNGHHKAHTYKDPVQSSSAHPSASILLTYSPLFTSSLQHHVEYRHPSHQCVDGIRNLRLPWRSQYRPYKGPH